MATFSDMAVSVCVFTDGLCMCVGIRDVGARCLFSRSGGHADFMINISAQICE